MDKNLRILFDLHKTFYNPDKLILVANSSLRFQFVRMQKMLPNLLHAGT